MLKYPVVFAVGTRPDIVKMAPVIRRFPAAQVWHTGQHYSPELNVVFLDEFDIHLDRVLSPGHAGGAQELFGPLVTQTTLQCKRVAQRGYMVVYGDTLSALAVAIGAREAKWGLIHIEAGLRSKDLSMPEEMARMTIDSMSHLLFAPTETQAGNLNTEKAMGAVHVVGNTIQDVVGQYRLSAPQKQPQALLTLHRRENADGMVNLIYRAVGMAKRAGCIEMLYPVHPNTEKSWRKRVERDNPILRMVEPMPYEQFIKTVQASQLVVTDSGGLQEECALLGVPCVTMRSSTERPETVDSGWNLLIHPSNATLWDFWHGPFDELMVRTKKLKTMRYGTDSPSKVIVEIMLKELPFILP